MSKRLAAAVVLALVLTGVRSLSWAAQEPTKDESQPKSMDSYKVEFFVSELANGRKINSRSYSMQIGAEASPKWTDVKRLRVGSRVPINVGANQIQYQDVGMNIDCRLQSMSNNKVGINTTWEYSSLAGEQPHNAATPTFRNVRSDVAAVVPLDKLTVISEVDDVASTNRYVFEVKVTKVAP